MAKGTYQIIPGRSLGPFHLGASLQETLLRLKKTQAAERSIDVTFSDSDPVTTPILVTIKADGIRLRFDGAAQRLRLIEVVDFQRSIFTYQGLDVFVSNDSHAGPDRPRAPSYRSIAKLFGPTFAPELIQSGDGDEVCVLSYPGLAFTFPASSPKPSKQRSDASSTLADSPNTTAAALAVFTGRSWSEARTNLFAATAPSTVSQSTVHATDIHHATLHGEGRITLHRHNGSSVPITLSNTTPQDIVSALGPPALIYHKRDRRLSIHQPVSPTPSTSAARARDAPSSETPFDHFYNYPHHGLDILVSTPAPPSAPSPTAPEALSTRASSHTNASSLPPAHTPVATKLLLHGNVPGSHVFNTHRRLCWVIEHCPSPGDPSPLDSEMKWDVLARRLGEVWGDGSGGADAMRGMRLERGWGGDVDLEGGLGGGFEEVDAEVAVGVSGEGEEGGAGGVGGGRGRRQGGGETTMLYGFPGMVFEVAGNGCVEGLLVY